MTNTTVVTATLPPVTVTVTATPGPTSLKFISAVAGASTMISLPLAWAPEGYSMPLTPSAPVSIPTSTMTALTTVVVTEAEH